MSLDLTELKRLHDKAYNHGQQTREQAANDMVFFYLTQWDDSFLEGCDLSYRGEFDIIRKGARQIFSDLNANPVSIDFEPKAESRQDGAELLDGLYRSLDRTNTSIEAFENASREAIVCGFGAWRLFTEYESTRSGTLNQVIRREPLYEANNNLFIDPNAKLADKSDMVYASYLHSYSEDGYQELHKELTGEEYEGRGPSFKYPEESYVFPWYTEDAHVYVSEFYHREKVKDKVLHMVDPLGQPVVLRESDLDDVMDEMIDLGYTIEEEKTVERWQVTRYIASGDEILDEAEIPGENIPFVPVYGERAFVESEEYYEGVTRLAKDPQRLRNFQMSYLADIVSRSPRPKPFFFPEQIQGFEDLLNETGADNNYPYYLQNRLAADGTPLPIGAIAQMPEQTIPQALIASLDLSRQAVEDVVNPGLPQNAADPDLSGKAIYALQNRLDQQSIVYQDHRKHAKRRDAEIYASMAQEVYDAPRTVTLTTYDGQRKTAQVMETITDTETGMPTVINDLTNTEFEVFADISPSYSTQRMQDREDLLKMVDLYPPGDPMREILTLKIAGLMDGNDFKDVRDYARQKLLLMGVVEPDTPEEEQMVAQANQQQQEPDAAMVLAQAEHLKGQAAMLDSQMKAQKAQAENQIDVGKLQVDAFEAETDRISAQITAHEKGANIRNKDVDTFGKQIDNTAKLATMRFRGRIGQRATQ